MTDRLNPQEASEQARGEHVELIKRYFTLVMEEDNKLQPPEGDISITPEEVEQARQRFDVFKKMMESVDRPLDRLVVSSTLEVVLGTSEGMEVFPFEARIIGGALRNSNADEMFGFEIVRDEEWERAYGKPIATVHDSSPEDLTFREITEADKDEGNIMFAPLVDQGKETSYFEMDGEYKLVNFEDLGDVEPPEGIMSDLRQIRQAYLGPVIHPEAENVGKLVAYDKKLGIRNYLNGVRESFKTEEFTSGLLDQIGYDYL